MNRRTRLLLLLGFAIGLAGAGLYTAGCKGCADGDKPPKRTPTPIDPATVGVIKGRAMFKGTPPIRRPIATGGDAACSQQPDPLSESEIVIPDSAGRQVVQNAFVWIKSGLPKDFVPAVPETEVVIDQKVCIFRPHVAGVQRYQTLRFTNSDQTEHNVKFAEPGKNPAHDKTMTGAGQNEPFWFPEEQVMMKVICNKHSWMKCWVGVCDHPWFAVTGPDGTFELKGVPPGTYTVGCWTESFGTKELQAKLDAKQTLDNLDFTFEKKE